MGPMIVTGTADGLYEIDLDGAVQRTAHKGREVSAISGDWIIADNTVTSLSSDRTVALPDDLVPRSLLSDPGGTCIVGTSDARLFELGTGEPKRVDSFDDILGRTAWSTPWGGAPDTRSMARHKGQLLVNVHVGGLWRAQEDVWLESVAPEADVHQVTADDDVVVVAAAKGIGQSNDGGRTFTWSVKGLIASYCRAAIISEDWLLVSASTGPAANAGSIYRRPLNEPEAPFETVGGRGDLPKLFAFNVDTHELAAAGELVALGTPTGDLYVSDDSGESWRLLHEALPGVRCVTFAS
jgi:hypothetical protein